MELNPTIADTVANESHYHASHGIACVIENERAATSEEADVGGSIAYDAKLYREGASPDAKPLTVTTFTVGPEAHNRGTAREALMCLASDALALRTIDAPRGTTDIMDPDVREAINEYSNHYGGHLEDVLRGYAISVKVSQAFEEAGADPDMVRSALE